MTIPDLLIVGAGPAGAALGGLLAAQGAVVHLVDAARFPRPKPCGECLNPGAVAALHRLGLWEAAAPLEPAGLSGWRMQVGRRAWHLDFPSGQRALAVDRRRLDQALVAWAVRQGARLTEGVRITDLLWEGGRVAGARAGRTPVPARYVVGADGLRSVVGRRLGAPGRGHTPPKVAFTGHWAGVEGLTDRGELHVQGPAVCGIAPAGRPGEANVVLVVPAVGSAPGPSAPAPWVARGLTDPWAALQTRWPDPVLRRRLANARPDGRPLATGPFDRPARFVHAPGALLVGDAAGYFDPLTGQGLYRALRSAELAAGALHQSLTTGDETAAFTAYQQRLMAEFTPAVRRQRCVDALVRQPAALAGALSLLGACPPGARWLMGLLGDCTCPKGATLP